MLGRRNAGDRLLILGDDQRFLGKVGRVVQARDRFPVDAQTGVDLPGKVGIDRFDDEFESDVAQDREHRENAQDEEETPDDRAQNPRERLGQRRDD